MKKDSFFVDLDSLIAEGINIRKFIEGINSEYVDYEKEDCELMTEIRKRYNLWRYDTQDFLGKKRINFAISSFFMEPDGVPPLDGGVEYSDCRSEKSQNTLKNIDEQTKLKLEKLREFFSLLQKNIKTKELPFEILDDNNDTFTLSFFGKIAKIPFKKKERWTHLCYLLISRAGWQPLSSVTDSEVLDYWKTKDKKYSFKDSPFLINDDDLRIKIQQTVETINKNLCKAFDSLHGKKVFEKRDGGVILNNLSKK